MSMKKTVLGVAVLLSIGVMLVGCGDEKKDAPKDAAKPAAQAVSVDLTGAKDGTFAADSAKHDQLGYSHVELTIESGAIAKVVHTGFDKDGKQKDESYGADKPEGVRKKAQNAYKAINSYASQLESKKDLAKVDAIAGATVSYDQFNEAVAKAVEAAKK
jgi:hypothetical protein